MSIALTIGFISMICVISLAHTFLEKLNAATFAVNMDFWDISAESDLHEALGTAK